MPTDYPPVPRKPMGFAVPKHRGAEGCLARMRKWSSVGEAFVAELALDNEMAARQTKPGGLLAGVQIVV